MPLQLRLFLLLIILVLSITTAAGLAIQTISRDSSARATADAWLHEIGPCLAATSFDHVEIVAAQRGVAVELLNRVERHTQTLQPRWLDLLETRISEFYPDSVVYLQLNDRDLRVQGMLPDRTWWSAVWSPPPVGSSPRLPMFALVAIALSVLAVGWLVLQRTLAPLGYLRRAAEAIGTDFQNVPIEESGSGVLQGLAVALNRMQFRLHRLLEDRDQMLASISHDLKTPLTRLRLRAERIADEDLRDRMVEELDELSSEVSSILELLRGLDEREPARLIDIEALVTSLVEDAAETGSELELVVETSPSRPVRARFRALKRCLSNLIDNARLYGRDQLSVVVGEIGHEVVIRVRDRGPGYSDRDLEQAFVPHYRGHESGTTGGSGLGLTIARRLARANGGDVQLANRNGGGAEATVKIPLAPP